MHTSGLQEKDLHDRNIAKYEWLLGTYLTDREREYVETRLAQEKTALNEARTREARTRDIDLHVV